MECLTFASANWPSPVLAHHSERGGVHRISRSDVKHRQFQDIALWKIISTLKILQGGTYLLASESMGTAVGEALPFVGAVPVRPNPVTPD